MSILLKKLQFLQNELPSSFSLEGFQSASFEGVGDTRRLRLEPGDYNATVVGPWGEKSKLEVKKGFVICEIIYQPDDAALREKYNVDRLPTVRQSIFLDVTPNGGLDMGPFKNADLNILLQAAGLGANGQPWKFEQLVGRPLKIKVGQRPNPQNPADPYTNVVGVTKI